MSKKKRRKLPIEVPIPTEPPPSRVRLRMLADLLAWIAEQLRKLSDAP
jgi:hypothetical protein